jgi:hypothetical protein
MPKTLVGWIVVFVLGAFVLSNPHQAGNALHSAFTSIMTFLQSL